MGHIAIKLNPRDLLNPDADCRYRIPDLIAGATNGRVRDDGYDYADGDIMIVYLSSDDPASDVADVIAILRDNEICDNRILDSAVIGIATDATTFKIVHPPETIGEFTVDPW